MWMGFLDHNRLVRPGQTSPLRRQTALRCTAEREGTDYMGQGVGAASAMSHDSRTFPFYCPCLQQTPAHPAGEYSPNA